MDLLDRSELEARMERGDVADWKATRYRTFHDTMTDDESPYPCYFAAEAERRGLFRYVFPESPDDDADRDALADCLAAFLDDYESIGEITSLVVLFRPPDDDLPAEAYKSQFWGVLDYLYRNDPEPWPASVPTDPDHPKWQFCFAGEPVFVVCRAPFYRARRSRYTPHGLEITVQPWGVFDGLTGLTDDGQEARAVIRDRLADYDDVEMHPDAGDFVDPRKTEWKQYLLPETNAESVERFPLSEREED